MNVFNVLTDSKKSMDNVLLFIMCFDLTLFTVSSEVVD